MLGIVEIVVGLGLLALIVAGFIKAGRTGKIVIGTVGAAFLFVLLLTLVDRGPDTPPQPGNTAGQSEDPTQEHPPKASSQVAPQVAPQPVQTVQSTSSNTQPVTFFSLGNYEKWKAASLESKRGYVIGYYYRSVTDLSVGDEALALEESLSLCVDAYGNDVDFFVGRIDRAFELNRQGRLWELPTHEIVKGVFHHTCLAYINEVRKEFKLPPEKPWGIWQ